MGRIIAACVVAMFGIVSLGVRAPATHADSVGGLGVYVAYADSLRANQPAFPTPWDGSPNTVFKGQEDAGSAYDAGAVRLDNFTSDAITVDSVHVFIHPNTDGGYDYNLWGSFTIQPGTSVILTQNDGSDNFDTSDNPINENCGSPIDDPSTVTITIGGFVTTLTDSSKILDTGGVDGADCFAGGNETHPWAAIGEAGGTSATLTLSPTNATQAIGSTQSTTATLLDSTSHGLPNVDVDFEVTSGPNAGLTDTETTDNQGQASFAYTSSLLGTDTVTASVTNSTGGVLDATDPATILWVNPSNLTYTGATSGDYGEPAGMSAKLTKVDGTTPLPNRKVTFALDGTDTCKAFTNASGIARCRLSPSEAAGTYDLVVNWAGDKHYAGATVTPSFLVVAEETHLGTPQRPQVILNGGSATLTARLFDPDSSKGYAGQMLTLTLGAQSCIAGPTNLAGSASCTINPVSQPLGKGKVVASFAGTDYYAAAANHSRPTVVFAFPSTGAFVVGDTTEASLRGSSQPITFWSGQWSTANTLSGGVAPSSMLGYAEGLTPSGLPTCGGSFTHQVGTGSPLPPAGPLPAYMGVLVTDKITQSSNTLSGNITHIVVVLPNASYANNTSHVGKGPEVNLYC